MESPAVTARTDPCRSSFCKGPPESLVGRGGVRNVDALAKKRARSLSVPSSDILREPERQRAADDDRQGKFSGHFEQPIQLSQTVRILNSTHGLQGVSWRGRSPGTKFCS